MNFYRHDETLFKGTSEYYSRYRIGYNDVVFDYLCKELSLSDGDLVLDLGCGTGQVSIPLARRGCLVYAVDPDVEMLREGLAQEKLCGPFGIRWILGNDGSLSRLRLPRFDLCAMGASFHWMDRTSTLMTLDRMLSDGAAVALLGGNLSPLGSAQCDWQKVVKEVVESYLGKERRAGKGTYRHPEKRHEVILKESPFHNITETSFENEFDLSVEHIVGLQLSSSYASPALLGDRVDAFRADLTQKLLSLSPEGRFPSKVRYDVIIGRR
jgi:ubiquinone/menaquinone biosynthesis C-methylase UbiE